MIGIISRYREKFYRAHHRRPLIALISLNGVEPLEGEPQVIACMSVKYRDSSFTSLWYGCCSVSPNVNEQRRHRINGTYAVGLGEWDVVRARICWRGGDIFLRFVAANTMRTSSDHLPAKSWSEKFEATGFPLDKAP